MVLVLLVLLFVLYCALTYPKVSLGLSSGYRWRQHLPGEL